MTSKVAEQQWAPEEGAVGDHPAVGGSKGGPGRAGLDIGFGGGGVEQRRGDGVLSEGAGVGTVEALTPSEKLSILSHVHGA